MEEQIFNGYNPPDDLNRVFALYSGCTYEGGGVTELYAKYEDIEAVALKKVAEENKHAREIHSDEPDKWGWQESKLRRIAQPGDSFTVRRWHNLVEEIEIISYVIK